MTDQNLTSSEQNVTDTPVLPLAFLLARPSYVVYITYEQQSAEFAWTMLPVPLELRGNDYSTQPLSNLMTQLVARLKCVVKSHQAVPALNEGTPMNVIRPRAIADFVEKEANSRMLTGWGPDVSDTEIAAIQLPFQEKLPECILAKETVVDDGIVEAEVLRDELN